MTTRKTTIQKRYVYRAFSKAFPFPEIRLTGAWLALAGFDCGDTCQVTVNGSQIIIEKNPKS